MNKLKLFYWSGRDSFCHKQGGTIIAETEDQARAMLLQRSLQNLKISRNWQFTTKVSNADICALLRQLAMLLKSSIPLSTGLQMLRQGSTNIALSSWLRQLIIDLESGLSLSQAIEKQGRYLNYQERQLIRVGEMTAQLAEVIEQLAQNRQQTLALTRKVKKNTHVSLTGFSDFSNFKFVVTYFCCPAVCRTLWVTKRIANIHPDFIESFRTITTMGLLSGLDIVCICAVYAPSIKAFRLVKSTKKSFYSQYSIS